MFLGFALHWARARMAGSGRGFDIRLACELGRCLTE